MKVLVVTWNLLAYPILQPHENIFKLLFNTHGQPDPELIIIGFQEMVFLKTFNIQKHHHY